MVRCTECGNKYQPIPVTGDGQVATIAPDGKQCPYCGEHILAVAKKCRHCGEIIDVALRAAEEAKSLARDRHQPVIVNNNVSTSSSAAAAAYAGHHRKSLFRSFLRFIFVFCVVLVGGAIIAGSGHTQLGTVLSAAGALMLIIGIPIYAVRCFMRIFFG
jgi:DNA-directed RNA polymerase subunit RPC12/RpoP